MPPHPKSEKGTFSPKVFITHVNYAVPGKSSSMEYSAGDTVGSSFTTSDANEETVKTTIGFEGDVFGNAKGSFSLAFGSTWGSSRADQTDVTLSQTNGYKKLGGVDDINHDDDEIWFLISPEFPVVATPDSFYGPGSLTWDFSTPVGGIPYYLYVGEILGTRPMPPGVKADLIDKWGFTQADLNQLLAADPFIAGLAPNTPLDPARFDLIETFPYKPVPAAGYPAASQTFTLNRKELNGTTLTRSIAYTTELQVKGGLGFFGIGGAFWQFNGSTKFTHSTSLKTAVTNEVQSKITVGQPAFGYAGPTVLRVYEDKIWKTFVFALDWY